MSIILQSTQSMGNIISIWAAVSQQQYNRRHKSVYNLSYDMILLNTIKQVISLYTALNYKYNALIARQLMRRYPVFYEVPRDIPVLQSLILLDLGLLLSYLMLQGQLLKYHMTKHVCQGVSIVCLCFLGALFGLLILPSIYLTWFGVHKFVFLDHINWCWVAGNAIHVTSMWPQISINWMGQCCTGLSMKFVMLNGIADIFRIIGFIITSKQGLPFYSWPFNSVPVFVAITELLSTLIILGQKRYWYRDNKPRLPTMVALTRTLPV